MRNMRRFELLLSVTLALLPGCATTTLPTRVIPPILHQEHERLVGELKALGKNEEEKRFKRFNACLGVPTPSLTASSEPSQPAGPLELPIPLVLVLSNSPTLKDDIDVPNLRVFLTSLHSTDVIDVRRHRHLFEEIVTMVGRLHDRIRTDQDQLIQKELKEGSAFGLILFAYYKAYFGTIEYELPEPGSKVKGVVKTVSEGFIDRNGNALRFPGVSAEVKVGDDKGDKKVYLESSAPDSKRLSADLVRIFLEALFDDALRVPAEANATVLHIKNPEFNYPDFSDKKAELESEDVKMVASHVASTALRVEATVTALVGNSVRGGGVFGTNNETLASVVETAAGVAAKKLAEHETYCFYVAKGKRV